VCAGIFGGVVQDVPLTRKGIRNETKAGWAKYCLNGILQRIRIRTDPHYFVKQDKDQSRKSGAVEAENGAMEGR
jgi:hypothetical protein